MADPTTAVDPDTTNAWSDIAASSTSTQNIGRIWTDKSVFDDDYKFSGALAGQTISKGEDSDFLVSLSALSSTSNTTRTVTVGTPVDIVLVLDESGSMEYGFDNRNTRRQALQEAANNFIDSANEANQGVPQENQIRMSIVTFSDGADVAQGWTYVTGVGTQSLHDTIGDLDQYGATRTDLGLSEADGQLASARQDAQKIVILFTDGDPSGSGLTVADFDCVTAKDAVNTANGMKDGGATVYTIGIFSGANPNTDNRSNNFLNAVSSNFPTATAEGGNGILGGFSWFDVTWGEGSRDNGYYKTAGDSEELNQVFEDIFDKLPVSEGSGSPIKEVTQEGELNPGTLTFTDTLGSYMTVSGDTMTVVYGDQMFTSTDKTAAGNVDTYHFEGTVTGNTVYKEANLANLTVTVTRSDNLATGDVVTVQIPASLLPMRNYDVDTDAKTMSVTDAYPIRLFYGVSVKADAKTAINQGSGDTYDAIVESNKTDDGKVAFYSNLYRNGDGDTTASFTPSDGNKFYYYTSDTALYVDQNCTQHATTQNINRYNTLYYSEPYWEITSGNTAQEVTRGIAINRDGQDWSKMTTDRQGNYYIPTGTQRLDRPASLNATKTNNETGTAETVLTPNWEGTGVVQRLGNNGKITYDLPGKLEIKKSVDWGNASDETKQNQNSFEFTVNFNGDETLEGNFSYDVYESDEDPVRSDKVADGGTITLEAGQRAVIKGLPADTTFTVTENEANKNGFTTTDTVTADPNIDTTDGIASGTIVGGSQQSVSFQNNYMADEPVRLSTETGLKVQKNLTGRDWRASDEFSFQITQIDNGAPTVQMADPTKVTVTQQTDQKTASFGDITFNASGQYRFRVEELSDADQGITPIMGIDYSGAIYRVTVDVADAGQGKLEIASVLIEQMINDDGGQGSGTVRGDTMAFENRYVSDQASETLQGTKFYTDTTGGNPIDAGKFSFQLEALGGYVTGTVTDEAQPDDYTIAANSDAMPKPAGMTGTTLETGNVGDVFQFPTIYFDGNDVGKTFEYRITELPQQYQGDAEQGMTYDTNTSYVVKIVVTEQQDPESEDPKVVIVAEPSLQPSDIKFTNKYEPKAAELTGTDAIHGTKTLDGREMKEGETFYFQLTATNDNAETVLASPETVTVTDQSAMDFAFNDMTFTKVGTYTFQVNEVANEQGAETTDDDGMTFDTNICTVTVDVTLNKTTGELEPTVSYSNDKHADATDHAQFTNVYTANMDYGATGAGGIKITKTMINRPINTDDFLINLSGNGSAGAYEVPAAALGSNGTAQSSVSGLNNLKFDQDDAGKTFTYAVTEAQGKLPGVKYDQSEYRVDVLVVDNQDGTMHAETTVTQTKDKDGSSVNNVVVDAFNSDTAQGQVPTFGFKNSYEPTEASLEGNTALQVTKKVTGAASPDGVNYTFTLTAQDTPDGSIANIGGLTDDKLMVSTSGVINADAADNTDDDTQTVSFGKLTFSAPGTYTFTVQEDQPVADAGWTFDDADSDGVTDAHEVTVVVSDLNENNEYDGALHIESVTPEDPIVITNSYKADPVIVGGDGTEQQITVQKTVTGADSKADFTFQLRPVVDDDHNEAWWMDRIDTVEEGYNGQISITGGVTQARSETANFGGIKFNEQGEYKFTVTEVGAGEKDPTGWTYDTHEATVTVNVTDTDFDGYLEASVSYDNSEAPSDADKTAQAAAFTNKYESTFDQGTAVTLGGTKYLDVAEGFTYDGGLPNGKFRFLFTALDGAPSIGDGQWNKPGFAVPETNDFQTTFSIFDKLTFSMADMDGQTTKDFVYIVTEKPGTDDDAGAAMTYDSSAYRVTITVTDDLAGNLTAGTPKIEKGSWDGQTFTANADQTGVDQVLFVNSYAPKSLDGAANLNVTKIIDDRKFQDGDSFTFTLTGGDDATKKAITDGAVILPKNADGIEIAYAEGDDTNTKSAAFGNIAFKTAGDYVFAVTETVPAGATNPNVDNGATTYENATPDQQAQGGWTLEGVTYGNQPHLVRVEVTVDGDGALVVTPDPDTINPTITNEYGTSGDTTLDTKTKFGLTKELTGTDWDTESFTFEVSGEDEQGGSAPTPANVTDGTYTVDAAAATNGKAELDFGTITFDKTGTYTYTIKEKVPADTQGITYDTHEVTVKVSVTDNLHGGIEANVTEVTGEKAFVNEYSTELVYQNEGGLDIVKNLTGHDMAAGQFGFTVKPVDTQGGATAQEAADIAGIPVTGKTFSVTADDMVGDGVATSEIAVFDANGFHFTQAHDGMSYTYTVEETTKGGAGYANDTSVYTVVISVKDDDAGKLTVTTAVHDSDSGTTAEYVYDNTGAQHDTAVVPFDNSYSASGSTPATGDAALTATKTLHNADLADYTFTFNMTNNNGDVVTRGTSDASGVVTFTPISYTTASLMADAQKGCCTYDADDDTFTYEYTVAEVNLPQGMTQNSTAQTVTVTVKDNGDGTLDARVSYPNGPLAFENTYGATSEATVNVAGSKTLVATDTAAGWKLPNIEGKFTFTVTGDSPLPVRADGAVATNVGGQIDLGTITYTMADMTDAADNADGTRTKTFTYTVTEAGTVDGVTNAAPQTFTVEVTDDTQGGLTAVASTLDTGMQVAFENTYTVTPQDESVTGDGTGAITLTKQLTGDRTTVAAGEFNFEMVDQSGAQVSTGTTAADGSVEMSPITFTKAGDLTYTLREIDEGHGGVDYDKASYQVVAHVSDANADGTLQVTWEVKAAADSQALTNVTFTNTYTAADTTVVLGGSKVLDGRALAEGEFSFQLTDAEGNVLGIVKNDAKGGFAFDAITYGNPGTYEYTISEVKGDAEGVIYDDATYAVKVVVTDDGQGKLQAEVTYNGEKAVPVFTNTYTEPVEPIEPEKPETVIPQTGDTTNMVLPLELAVGGVALVAGSLTVAKRRSK